MQGRTKAGDRRSRTVAGSWGACDRVLRAVVAAAAAEAAVEPEPALLVAGQVGVVEVGLRFRRLVGVDVAVLEGIVDLRGDQTPCGPPGTRC